MRKILLLFAVLSLGFAHAIDPIAGETDGAGMKSYNRKCAVCHGKDGVAKKNAKGSADLNDPAWQQSVTLKEIEEVTAEGKGKMPKFLRKLTPEEIKLVAKYVMSLKPSPSNDK